MDFQANGPDLSAKRQETAESLQAKAEVAANRIAQGIALLEDPQCLAAFKLANHVMAVAGRRRLGIMQGNPPESITPEWRPFQLAFLLMNLPGIARPTDKDREGGGPAVFPHRRRQDRSLPGAGRVHPDSAAHAESRHLRRRRQRSHALHATPADAGSVRPRGHVDLRLGIGAPERRQRNLGDWPFEIGLWVGRAATPNRMGRKGDKDRESARARTIEYLNDERKPSPIPLEECPWCGTKFKPLSFKLLPNNDEPTDLRIRCVNRNCDFGRGVLVADSGSGRSDLSPPALLHHRDRR